MPTGYTSSVQDGATTEVKDFILSCAKGFGAFIHTRDDGLSPEIKYKEVGEHYPRRLEETKREFEKFKLLSDEDIQKQLDENYESNIKSKRERLKRFDLEKQRYLDMIDKVEKWNPPTEDHIKLKKFALEQLEDSLYFDCSESIREYYLKEVVRDTVEEYKARMIKNYLKDIEYYAKCYREELEGVETTNKWIKDLVESL